LLAAVLKRYDSVLGKLAGEERPTL
jgi:hypothetical protein